MIFLHFTIIYALEVIYVCRICVMETLDTGVPMGTVGDSKCGELEA